MIRYRLASFCGLTVSGITHRLAGYVQQPPFVDQHAMAVRGATLAAIAIVLAAPACAMEQPQHGKEDGRIRFVNYDPNNVVRLWTAAGATMTIQFGEGETITNVSVPDAHTLKAEPKENFLFLKAAGCLIPEPVTVLTRNTNGKVRPYNFEIHTNPQICPAPGAPHPAVRQVSVDGGNPPGTGNLKLIASDALSENADVMYFVKFAYPGDDAARRREAAARRQARQEKEETSRNLSQQTESSARDPYSGNRNYRYAARGDGGLQPRWVWDNGYSTVFVFPSLQRVPSVFRLDPDGKEATADYAVHGDTVIANGIAQMWRLRDGATVMEVWDLSYNPVGSTPATGTASPQVERVLKGAADDR